MRIRKVLLLKLILILQQRKIKLLQLIRFYAQTFFTPTDDPATRKYLHFIRRHITRPRRYTLRPQDKPRNRGSILDTHWSIPEMTGLYEHEFIRVYQIMLPYLRQPRKSNATEWKRNNLNEFVRLLMVLHILRSGLQYRDVKLIYDVSKSYVSREIHYLLPLLFEKIHFIKWPTNLIHPIIHGFPNVIEAVDCTSHFRNRVHPNQAEFYRGDKHRFFITAQVVTGLDGQFYNVVLGLGHNNDKGMYRLSGLLDRLHNNTDCLLADSGYSDFRLITPDENNMPREWNIIQHRLRSVVEVSIGYAQT